MWNPAWGSHLADLPTRDGWSELVWTSSQEQPYPRLECKELSQIVRELSRKWNDGGKSMQRCGGHRAGLRSQRPDVPLRPRSLRKGQNQPTTQNSLQSWKLRKSPLNNSLVKQETMEIRECLEPNDNTKTTHQNSWNAAEAALGEKSSALQAHVISKEDIPQKLEGKHQNGPKKAEGRK